MQYLFSTVSPSGYRTSSDKHANPVQAFACAHECVLHAHSTLMLSSVSKEIRAYGLRTPPECLLKSNARIVVPRKGDNEGQSRFASCLPLCEVA